MASPRKQMEFGFKQPFNGGEALRDDPNNGCGGDYQICGPIENYMLSGGNGLLMLLNKKANILLPV